MKRAVALVVVILALSACGGRNRKFIETHEGTLNGDTPIVCQVRINLTNETKSYAEGPVVCVTTTNTLPEITGADR